MLKIAGSFIILSACWLYGYQLSQKSEKDLLITDALVSFVMFINASIKTNRMPLRDIFSDFTNEELHNCGFINALNESGLSDAISSIEVYLTVEASEAMLFLDKNIGGIDLESQTRVCDYVEEKLREEYAKIKSNYKEKRRMYRLLPILAGLSVIVLAI